MLESSIIGAQLVLTPLTLDDAPRLFEYRSDPAVRRFQCFEPESVEDACAFIRATMSGAAGWRQFGIRMQGSPLLVGDVGFRFIDDERPQAEVGVTIAPEQQGRGLAKQVMTVLLGHLFAELDVHRAFASVDPRNTASVALFRRLGMRQEGHFRQSLWFKGEWADDIVFALLKTEWQHATV